MLVQRLITGSVQIICTDASHDEMWIVVRAIAGDAVAEYLKHIHLVHFPYTEYTR